MFVYQMLRFKWVCNEPFFKIYFIFINSKETNNGKSFETVKHGSRTLESLADRRPRLDLENKFDALGRS